jgi:hypothetical protein
VVVNDDLDGSEGAETIVFSLGGVSYEIDLSQKNRAKLHKALAPYIEHGRRVATRRPRSGITSASPRVDRAALRAWAKGHGLKVSERGRISAELMEQYEAAH